MPTTDDLVKVALERAETLKLDMRYFSRNEYWQA